MQKRVLGLDVGDKRIGLAVSDPMGVTAQFVGTLVRSQTGADFDRLLETAEEYDVDSIVVGLPRKPRSIKFFSLFLRISHFIYSVSVFSLHL